MTVRYIDESSDNRWKDWGRTATLLRYLTKRHLAERYRGSSLGFLWSLMNPILLMLVYAFVFQVVLRVPTGDVPFPAFLLTGLFAWNFFSTATLNAAVSIVGGGPLLSRVYFPRYILPLSAVLSNLLNYLAVLPLLVVFDAAFGILPGKGLLWFPLGLVLVFTLACGLGLLLASLAPLFRDLMQVLDILFLALFFASPVVYPAEQALRNLGPNWAALYQANPLVGILSLLRGAFLGEPVLWGAVGVSAVFAAGLLWIGIAVFRRYGPQLLDSI